MLKRFGDIKIKISGSFDGVINDMSSPFFVNRTQTNNIGFFYLDESIGYFTDCFKSRLVSISTSHPYVLHNKNLLENLRELTIMSFQAIPNITFQRLIRLEVSQFGRYVIELELFDNFADKNQDIKYLCFNQITIFCDQ